MGISRSDLSSENEPFQKAVAVLFGTTAFIGIVLWVLKESTALELAFFKRPVGGLVLVLAGAVFVAVNEL
jgi:hypothetical protein